ncbi:MAG: glutamine--fructose-6-phosphate transaminase (isomerizing) [bacterium]|nr:glutamine--fructose-6-phosphate transaminase (isomerizing) [bacterium]
MCGLVGYIGKKQALPIVLEGLKRLEYRGYDSVGVLIFDKNNGKIYLKKQPGRIHDFIKIINHNQTGNLGIGHSRWATHGKVNEVNSHPHWDCAKKIFVVHNGIIENFQEIKEALIKKGHRFISQTDTEVVPHLIEDFMKKGLPYKSAVIETLKKIKGSFALLIFNIDFPDMLVGARLSSPLILGIGKNEFILASDATPISLLTKKVAYLEDGQAAFVGKNGYQIKSFLGKTIKTNKGVIDFSAEQASKKGFSDFMLKEIFEEPQAVRNTLRGRILLKNGQVKLGGLENAGKPLVKTNNVLLTGCGTAFFAAKLGEYMLEEYAQISAKSDLASELRYRHPKINSQTLLTAISQSGETADTLAVIREMKSKKVPTIGIVNVVGSSIARLVDAGIYSHAGPEMAVASTKAFLAQITDLVLLTVFLGKQQQMADIAAKKILQEIIKIPAKMEQILAKASLVRKLAKKYRRYRNFLYLGRKYSFPVALEGALKIKEIAYVHAEGLAAGETKHGPIALVDKNFVTVAVCPEDSVYEKTLSNLQEIKARNGKIIAIASRHDKRLEKLADDVIYVPKTIEMLSPLLTVVPLHLFAYYFAKELGHDIDRPRNLAKSVTVE